MGLGMKTIGVNVGVDVDVDVDVGVGVIKGEDGKERCEGPKKKEGSLQKGEKGGEEIGGEEKENIKGTGDVDDDDVVDIGEDVVEDEAKWAGAGAMTGREGRMWQRERARGREREL